MVSTLLKLHEPSWGGGSWRGDSAVFPSSVCFEMTAHSGDLYLLLPEPSGEAMPPVLTLTFSFFPARSQLWDAPYVDVQNSCTHLHSRAGNIAWQGALAQQECCVGKPQL